LYVVRVQKNLTYQLHSVHTAEQTDGHHWYGQFVPTLFNKTVNSSHVFTLWRVDRVTGLSNLCRDAVTTTWRHCHGIKITPWRRYNAVQRRHITEADVMANCFAVFCDAVAFIVTTHYSKNTVWPEQCSFTGSQTRPTLEPSALKSLHIPATLRQSWSDASRCWRTINAVTWTLITLQPPRRCHGINQIDHVWRVDWHPYNYHLTLVINGQSATINRTVILIVYLFIIYYAEVLLYFLVKVTRYKVKK